MRSNIGWVTLLSALLGAGTLVLACTDDDDAPSGGTTSSSGGSSSGATSSTSSSGATSSSSGATSSTSSGGDAGDGGGGKANGATCDGDGECASQRCFKGGAGGGDGGVAGVCTVACTKPRETDPACAGAPFSGKCNGQSFCQISQ